MNQIHRCQPLLGTFVEVTLQADQTEDYLLALSQKVFAAIKLIHKKMSFHESGSELSHINAQAYQQDVVLSADMQEVLLQAIDMSQKTDGLFDVCIAPKLVKRGLLPDCQHEVDAEGCWQDISIRQGKVRFHKKLQVDLGGIAKGYAADCGLSVVPEGVQAIINAGGDIRMSPWQEQSVHIRAPNNRHAPLIEMNMRNAAVATSAAYFQEGDVAAIMHPTKSKIVSPSSVTVFASSAMLADALTKLVFLRPKCAQILQDFSAEAFYVNQQGEQHWVNKQ